MNSKSLGQIFNSSQESTKQTLLNFWKRLGTLKKLSAYVYAGSNRFQGVGEVVVLEQTSTTIVTSEKGEWEVESNQNIRFTNSYRWSLDLHAHLISLEHMRYGKEVPVFLCDLVPSGPQKLSSVDPHLCKQDTYSCLVQFDQDSFKVVWHAVGPKKNDGMVYTYH